MTFPIAGSRRRAGSCGGWGLVVVLLTSALLPDAASADDILQRFFEGAAHVLVHTDENRSIVLFPAITTDPNTGPTFGPLPVLIWLDQQKEVRHIVATSVTYNHVFGVSGSLRYDFFPDPGSKLTLLGYLSEDTNNRALLRYEDVAGFGGSSRVHLELEEETDGSRRFFGFGSRSLSESEAAYTLEERQLVTDVGREILGGASLVGGWTFHRNEVRQSPIHGLPQIARALRTTTTESGPRIGLVRDTRDVPKTPTFGSLVELAALFARDELGSNTSFVRLTFDAGGYVPFQPYGGNPVVFAGRIRLEQNRWGAVPFSSQSFLGGEGLLRGFGEGRFVDRGLAVGALEERIQLYRIDLMNRVVELELAPFFEIGTVFHDLEAIGSGRFHPVGGIGFRGVVRPTVVGKVDVGFGDEGPAVFTGIDYPF